MAISTEALRSMQDEFEDRFNQLLTDTESCEDIEELFTFCFAMVVLQYGKIMGTHLLRDNVLPSHKSAVSYVEDFKRSKEFATLVSDMEDRSSALMTLKYLQFAAKHN